jgi:hypothetical protein
VKGCTTTVTGFRGTPIFRTPVRIDINGLIIRGLGKFELVHDVFDGGRASTVPTGQTSEAA